MQTFVSQPTENGEFCVAKKNHNDTNYIPLEVEVFITEEESKRRASELNMQYEEECKNLKLI